MNYLLHLAPFLRPCPLLLLSDLPSPTSGPPRGLWSPLKSTHLLLLIALPSLQQLLEQSFLKPGALTPHQQLPEALGPCRAQALTPWLNWSSYWAVLVITSSQYSSGPRPCPPSPRSKLRRPLPPQPQPHHPFSRGRLPHHPQSLTPTRRPRPPCSSTSTISEVSSWTRPMMLLFLLPRSLLPPAGGYHQAHLSHGLWTDHPRRRRRSRWHPLAVPWDLRKPLLESSPVSGSPFRSRSPGCGKHSLSSCLYGKSSWKGRGPQSLRMRRHIHLPPSPPHRALLSPCPQNLLLRYLHLVPPGTACCPLLRK